MRTADIDWRLNTYGADTLQLMIDGINRHNPDLQLTKANSKILMTMPYGDPSLDRLTIIRIQKGEDISDVYEFVYSRHDINDVAAGKPALTTIDKDTLKAMDNSEAMLKYIAQKFNVAYTPDDFWVSPNSKEYTGGTTQPNWLMKTQYKSLCWWNEMIVHLH